MVPVIPARAAADTGALMGQAVCLVTADWPVIVVRVLAVIVVVWLIASQLRGGPRLPYNKVHSLLTAAEWRFYWVPRVGITRSISAGRRSRTRD
jgi:hypothetical protein